MTHFVDENLSRTATCYQITGTSQYVRIWTLAPGSVCPSGFALETLSHDSQRCPLNLFQYEDCVSQCSGCSNCEDTGTWGAGNTGYEKRTKKTCNTSTCICETSTEYRCAKGYYGTSTNGTSGCTRCPRMDTSDLFSPFGTTDSAGQVTVYSCYIPAGASFQDLTGSGIYPDQCDYERGFDIIDPVDPTDPIEPIFPLG